MTIQPVTSPPRPTSIRRVTVRLALAVLALTAVVTACGPSSSTSSSSAVPTTAPVATTATSATAELADCPFSGTKEPSQGSGVPNAVLNTVQTSKAGCIDNIAFPFATLPPSWTVSYANGPFVDAATGKPITVPGPTTLVITFLATTYAGTQAPGGVPADNLDYVDDIHVAAGPNGSLQYIISLEERAEYLTSVSRVPSNFILAIG